MARQSALRIAQVESSPQAKPKREGGVAQPKSSARKGSEKAARAANAEEAPHLFDERTRRDITGVAFAVVGRRAVRGGRHALRAPWSPSFRVDGAAPHARPGRLPAAVLSARHRGELPRPFRARARAGARGGGPRHDTASPCSCCWRCSRPLRPAREGAPATLVRRPPSSAARGGYVGAGIAWVGPHAVRPGRCRASSCSAAWRRGSCGHRVFALEASSSACRTSAPRPRHERGGAEAAAPTPA